MHNDISFPHSCCTLDTHCLLQERSCKIDTVVITVELRPQTTNLNSMPCFSINPGTIPKNPHK